MALYQPVSSDPSQSFYIVNILRVVREEFVLVLK